MSSRTLNIRTHRCTLYIRSFINPLHYTAIADLVDTNKIGLFALTETWISPNITPAQLIHAIPHGFTFISTPCLVPDTCTSSIVGGSIRVLLVLTYLLLLKLKITQFFVNIFHPGLAFLLLLSYTWIKTYLRNRLFFVNIQNAKSSVVQLIYGVPQISVLYS